MPLRGTATPGSGPPVEQSEPRPEEKARELPKRPEAPRVGPSPAPSVPDEGHGAPGLLLGGGCRARPAGAGPVRSSWAGGTALWVKRRAREPLRSWLGARRPTAAPDAARLGLAEHSGPGGTPDSGSGQSGAKIWQ